MFKRYLYLIGLLAVSRCYGQTANVSKTDAYGNAATINGGNGASVLKCIGATCLLDAQLNITQPLDLYKYEELISISTPSTPASNHARLWYNGITKQVCVKFDDDSTTCFGIGGSTTTVGSFIRNQSVLQPGAKFHISSGTVDGQLTVGVVKFSTTGVLATAPSVGVSHTFLTATDVGDGIFVGHPYQDTLCLGDRACASKVSGEDDVGFGPGVLRSATTSKDNTAVGDHALTLLTTGIDNTAMGSSAMPLINGSFNTCYGVSCMQGATLGDSNTCMGTSCLSSLNSPAAIDNVAIGVQSGFLTTTARQNSFLGDAAGYHVSIGTGNVCVGYQSCDEVPPGAVAITSGSYNTYLGFRASGADQNLYNSISIGQNAIVQTSNTAQMGGTTGSGNEVNLHVTSATVYTYFSDTPNISSLGKMRFSNSDFLGFRNGTNSGDLLFGVNSTQFHMSAPLVIGPSDNQLVLGSDSGTNAIGIRAPTPASNRTYTIPDVGVDADFVLTQGAQNISGTKVFNATQTFNSPILVSTITGTTYRFIDTNVIPSTTTDISTLVSFDFHGIDIPQWYNDSADMIALGYENHAVIRNTTVSTITPGQVVYISGETGNVPNVALAQANSTTTMRAMAVAQYSIAPNAYGEVQTFGNVPFNTNAFSAGDTLYVSTMTAGGLTNVEPLWPNLSQRVGYVTVKGIGNGSAFINIGVVHGNDYGTARSTWTANFVLTSSAEVQNMLDIDKALDFEAVATNPPTPNPGEARLHATTFHGFTRVEEDNEAPTNLVYARDNVFIGKNIGSGTILPGQPVYVNGSTGNAPNVDLALSSTSLKMPAVGVVLDSITAGSFGQIMVTGLISNINTSAFTAGDQLWVSTSTAGGLTNVRPLTPNIVQRLGNVLVSGTGNGQIQVEIAPFLGGLETGTRSDTFKIGSTATPGIILDDTQTSTFTFAVKASSFIGDGSQLTGIGSGVNREDYVVGTALNNYTGSTTAFKLVNTYSVGTHNLLVAVDGVLMTLGASADYLETNSSTVTFNRALVTGQTVSFIFSTPPSGSQVAAGTAPQLAYYASNGSQVTNLGSTGLADSTLVNVTTRAYVLTSSGTSVAPVWSPPQLTVTLSTVGVTTVFSTTTLYTTPNDNITHLYRIIGNMYVTSSATEGGALGFGLRYTDNGGGDKNGLSAYTVPTEGYGYTQTSGGATYTFVTTGNPTLSFTTGNIGNTANITWIVAVRFNSTIQVSTFATSSLTGSPVYNLQYSLERLN